MHALAHCGARIVKTPDRTEMDSPRKVGYWSVREVRRRVTVAPGASNPRHSHAHSEQVWVALRGNARLLLDGSTTEPFREGDVVRFVDGDVHDLENLGAEDFVYFSVTSPPINFRAAYSVDWRESEGNDAA